VPVRRTNITREAGKRRSVAFIIIAIEGQRLETTPSDGKSVIQHTGQSKAKNIEGIISGGVKVVV
jgi:hypothetical protein